MRPEDDARLATRPHRAGGSQIGHAGDGHIMRVPVGVWSAGAAHRLRSTTPGSGSNAPVDNTLLIGVLPEELALSQGVLIYALPLLRLLLGGFLIGLPVASAVRKGVPFGKIAGRPLTSFCSQD